MNNEYISAFWLFWPYFRTFWFEQIKIMPSNHTEKLELCFIRAKTGWSIIDNDFLVFHLKRMRQKNKLYWWVYKSWVSIWFSLCNFDYNILTFHYFPDNMMKNLVVPSRQPVEVQITAPHIATALIMIRIQTSLLWIFKLWMIK